MADEKVLAILRQGADAWNEWRRRHPNFVKWTEDRSRAEALFYPDFSGADLAGKNLRGANLSEASFNATDLSGADLQNASLARSRLSKANLTGANLSAADLSHADLSGADLSGADLTWANLRMARLSNANLSDADLSDADLSDAILPGTQIHGADFSRSDLSQVDLSLVKGLSAANLNGANLVGADLGDLDDGCLTTPNSDFYHRERKYRFRAKFSTPSERHDFDFTETLKSIGFVLSIIAPIFAILLFAMDIYNPTFRLAAHIPEYIFFPIAIIWAPFCIVGFIFWIVGAIMLVDHRPEVGWVFLGMIIGWLLCAIIPDVNAREISQEVSDHLPLTSVIALFQ